MLGLIRSERRWQWAAYGKHPSAKDYFKVGQYFPLLDSFLDWIEKGYYALASKKPVQGLCSWRFWTRESRKQNLVCGLIRDSNDSYGRPYPLLIIGTGPLKDWEDQWDLLPYACERTWSQVEYLSTHIFSDIKKLEVEVQNIRPPHPEWSEFTAKRADFRELNLTLDLSEQKNQVESLSGKSEGFIYLDSRMFPDQSTRINFCHLLLKRHLKFIPNVIFMGGTIDKTFLVFYKRPLTPSDFMQLWSVSPSDNITYHGNSHL